MNNQRMKRALIALQWVLGLVILIEAIIFVMPAGRHAFQQAHMPESIRLILGWGEIIGCALLLIPATTVRGVWILIGIFALAIVIHLLHGMHNVGNLVIYIAAAWVITAGQESSEVAL